MGCGGARARLPRDRGGDRGQRPERRPLPACAPRAAAPARRPPLLSPAAAATAAPDPELPAAGDLRVRSLSRRRSARRSSTRPPAGTRDRRGPRRLADVLAPVRLACTPADQSSCRRGRGPGGPAGRRDARCLELHGGPRRGDARGAAERCLHGVQRPVGVRRAAARLAPRTADGGIRRRARGVQERRRARRCVASRRRAGACCRARDRRQRLPAGGRRPARRGLSRPGRARHVARARGCLASGSMLRRCSCCRPGRRASAA